MAIVMINNTTKLVINLIQDIATPHNNVLIQQFVGRKDVEIKIWYATDEDQKRYQWKENLTHTHLTASVYGRSFNIEFIRYCMAKKEERFIIVGWANANTRLLHIIFFLLRRPFNHWTDLPDPKQKSMSWLQKALRIFAYKLLRHSRCKVFAVGKSSIDCFKRWGFPDHMLENLPIFVSTDDPLEVYRQLRPKFDVQYNVQTNGFLISAGSRLVHDKGYDLLLDAIAIIPKELRLRLKVVIVGNGEEAEKLKRQIDNLNLKDCVLMEPWLDISDFKALIANSDVFVHPARFDSYGGSALGMALGVPVVGSTGAGAAVDRIEHAVNGFLYDVTDTKALAGYITQLLSNPELRRRIGNAGRQTALQWPPSRGVDIVVRHSI